MSKAEFGRYLASVEERDIDLLLMEEFQITDEFVAWFCAHLGILDVEPVGAWHSVSDTDGETDLLLMIIVGTRRIGVMIENKINAPEQDRQAERYHLRGIGSCEAGKFDEYVTVMCAPQQYLDGLPADSPYQHRISYEAIADWFASCKGRRAAWRHKIMQEAMEQGRRGYTMLVNATRTTFHMEYWEHVQRNHPRIHMHRPTNKGSKSNWIIMKGHDFPKGVKIHHKVDQQTVELGFQGRRVEEISDAKSDWPEDILIIQKGKTASLMIRVPTIDLEVAVALQIDAIEEALGAAYRLMPFAILFSAIES